MRITATQHGAGRLLLHVTLRNKGKLRTVRGVFDVERVVGEGVNQFLCDVDLGAALRGDSVARLWFLCEGERDRRHSVAARLREDAYAE